MTKEILKAFYNYYFTPKYPLCLVLYLTNVCNLRCGFCEIGLANSSRIKRNEPAQELSKDEIDECINLCHKTGIDKVYITGGEPFLSNNLFYLLSQCKKHNLIVEDITSNGVSFYKLKKEDIQLINDVVKNIIVSIDSYEAKEHDKNRGVEGVFHKIERFFNCEREDNFNNLNFSFNVVVHKNNFTQLKGIIDLGLKWHIQHINFQPVSPETIFPDIQVNGLKEDYIQNLHLGDFRQAILEAAEYAKGKNISTNLKIFKLWAPLYFEYLRTDRFFFEEVSSKFFCSKVFNFIHINYRGDLLPCSNLKPITNLRENDYFEKWQNYGKKIKILFKEKKYFNQCKSCFCDYPANLRYSLLYFPFSNFRLLCQLSQYYLRRKKIRYG
jgi:MoaA/NifB/PqqE/SkfB family radical SAM enzyme